MHFLSTATKAVLVLGIILTVSIASAHAEGWGEVKGQVVLAGTAPAVQNVNVVKCAVICLAKGPIPNEELVVNPKNNGVQWVFVWLTPDSTDKTAKLPIKPELVNPPAVAAEIDQPCCRFIPHALAIRQGQSLIAKNSGTIPHNVHWTGHPIKNPGGNILLPTGAQQQIELKADRFPVKVACDIHGWMNAWVRVFDHPYFALTDEDGSFSIKDAPAGPVRMVIWHETGYGPGGKDGTKVEIKAGEATDLGKLTMKKP